LEVGFGSGVTFQNLHENYEEIHGLDLNASVEDVTAVFRPFEQTQAFWEIRRVLKPGGQAIYGVPIERGLMVLMFRLLGYKIREHHFSTEKEVFNAADSVLDKVRVVQMQSIPSLFGSVYEIGHFIKGRSQGQL
jgi:ubiquinone/menaquinone biosynthesis C-methylase UbiE